MNFTVSFDIVGQVKAAIQAAFLPTLIALLRNPILLIRPHEVSRIIMAHVWRLYANGIDDNARPTKEKLLPANCYGVVLDIGAGHGQTALYLDPTKVTKYVALEPNTLMHPKIRITAAKNGFTEETGTLLILPYGAEKISLITSAFGGAHAVDTLVSIFSLCSIPDPEQTLTALVNDVLKPGGTLLFYEHVLSPREDVARWQRFWTPVWIYIMDGCRMDRPTHLWIENMDAWAEGSVWGKDDEPEEHLFWRRAGRSVKKDD
ncbi:hypothetical protein BD309DRAFT_929379 [Dichomitus squalens]|uniref:Uncharacterized protein n=1 Tax=Dichomitus squalens TaxID=114155 RepID=A0A4V2K349_9APHY|nr:hypothetical protein BD309DRAFT_929379 [Dichomitus squalens]TBU52205.1 hypothetical protein BD310DRAFT_862242 [Dichomitus squalens]